jgi:hypothetical protein
MEFWNIGMLRWGRSSFQVPLFHHSILPPVHSRTLLARAIWLALPATRAVAKRKQQKKGK